MTRNAATVMLGAWLLTTSLPARAAAIVNGSFEDEVRSADTFCITIADPLCPAITGWTGAFYLVNGTPGPITPPTPVPDGSQIVCESERGGKQQIFSMSAGGSEPARISFGDGSYSTPVWSPRGDLIAFTKQSGGQFSIGVMKTDGSGERILTSGFLAEGPTWAPNGRVLAFYKNAAGGNPALYSIDLTGYNEQQIPTPGAASDPAWSPLLE